MRVRLINRFKSYKLPGSDKVVGKLQVIEVSDAEGKVLVKEHPFVEVQPVVAEKVAPLQTIASKGNDEKKEKSEKPNLADILKAKKAEEK